MSEQNRSFRFQVAKSASLLSLRFASAIGLRLISTVVLSRLLEPQVYGIFATVMVYIYILEMVSDMGLRSLILTREGEISDRFLRTCWTISILRGGVILSLSLLVALAIALLQGQNIFALDGPYVSPDLPYAILAIGASMLLFGFEAPYRFMAEREMKFGRVVSIDVARDLITLVVTIALAFYMRSIWALVIGNLVRSCIHVVLSFTLFTGPRLVLLLDRVSLQILIDRGKWVLGQSALTAVFQSFDKLFLGFVMSSTSFGLYFIARQLVDVVPKFLGTLNGGMILQVFTRLQKTNILNFRQNYYRYRLVVDSLAGGAAGILLVLSPLIVEIIFDDRYAEVAQIMQVLTLSLLLSGMLVMVNSYTAARQFNITTYLLILSSGVLVLALILAALVVNSVNLALYVIALHRLPEAILVTFLGLRKGWVVLWREGIILIFFGFGALVGWGILKLWILITV